MNASLLSARHPNRPLSVCAILALLLLFAGRTGTAYAGDEPPLVMQLLQQYRQIETVSCDVRREVKTPDGAIRWLSRVYYQAPDKLHARNAAPLPRLVISDGKTMYQHNEGQPRGFRRPLEDLDETMQINLHRIPGTLMDHLSRIGDAPESPLEPTPDAPIRRAYETRNTYIILEADEKGRLLQVYLFDAKQRNEPVGTIVCEAFEEVIPNVWIPMSHRITFRSGEHTIEERIRFSQYHANQELPEHIFTPGNFFPDVEWVDSFDQL